MKKIFTVFFAAVLTLSLCSCGLALTRDEVKGSVVGDTYENDYLGLKFTNPAGWNFLSDEEVSRFWQDTMQEYGNDVDTSFIIYDMMTADEKTANNIFVLIEYSKKVGKVDLDELLDDFEEQTLEQGSAVGISYTFSEHSTVKLSGVEFRRIIGTADIGGVTCEQGYYMAYVNGVLCNIAITVYDDTPISDIEAVFN